MSQSGPLVSRGHVGETVLSSQVEEAPPWLWYQGLQLYRHQQRMGKSAWTLVRWQIKNSRSVPCIHTVLQLFAVINYSDMVCNTFQLYIRRILISEGQLCLNDALKVRCVYNCVHNKRDDVVV